MNHTTATVAATTHNIDLVHRDATLTHWQYTPVWLDRGTLMMSHPTDRFGLPIDAPTDGLYAVHLSPDELLAASAEYTARESARENAVRKRGISL